jgi:hypothetical protein
MDWKERERLRHAGRTMPVWTYEPWWMDRSETLCDHFVHVAAGDHALLAYTQDADKGERDIQTPIKPGRYLSRYFGDVLTAKQIAFFASWQVTGKRETTFTSEADYPLAFADEADDIVRVYQNGPNSCMGPRHFDDKHHPCRVYAAGDLAIAYLTRTADNKIVARALVWPKRKAMGRVYPSPDNWSQDGFATYQDSLDCQAALFNRLRDLGYRNGDEGRDFNGAKLEKIDHHRHGHVMPYLDNGYQVDDGEECWIMRPRGRGDYDCENTDGTLNAEEEEEDDRPECDNCGDRMDDDDQNGVYTRCNGDGGYRQRTWCDHCTNNNTFRCEGFDETFSNDVEYEEVDGCIYALAYLETHATRSDHRDGGWILDGDGVTLANGDTWHREQFDDDGFTCQVTGENYSQDDEHPDHAGVFADVDPDALAAWLDSNRLAAD